MARTHEGVGLIVYPFPVLVVVGTAARATRLCRLLPMTPLLPLATYLGWTRLAARRRKLGPLAYPYLRMAVEIATMAGEAQVLVARLESVDEERAAHGR